MRKGSQREGMRGPGLEGDSLIALRASVAVPPVLFSGPLARQGLLHAPPLSWLQVVRVTFHFLDDVFRLHFTLKPAQGIFQRLSLLQSNFCQFDLLPVNKSLTAYIIISIISQGTSESAPDCALTMSRIRSRQYTVKLTNAYPK